MRIETARLCLRPLTIADLDAVAAIWADPAVMRYITGIPRSRAASATRLERILEHHAQHGFSLWAVLDQASAELIGYCGLQYLDNTSEVEVGYGFAKSHWGQGFATEAAIASVDYGFQKVGLDRIVGITHPANIASRRVLIRTGLQYEKDAHYYNTNVVYYAAMRDEWLQQRKKSQPG